MFIKNMNNKIFLSLIFSIFLISMASAIDYSFSFERNTENQISAPCTDSSEIPCSTNVNCNLTIDNSNGTVLVSNQKMILYPGGTYKYNLTKNDTLELGEYIAHINCIGSLESGFGRFAYLVTPTGSRTTTTSESIILTISIIIMSLFALFFFIVGMKVNSGIMSLIFVFISGTLLFTTTMFTVTVVSDNLSIIGNSLEGYATYLLIIKSLVSISITFLVLFGLYKAFKLWGLKRGLVVE